MLLNLSSKETVSLDEVRDWIMKFEPVLQSLNMSNIGTFCLQLFCFCEPYHTHIVQLTALWIFYKDNFSRLAELRTLNSP